MLWMYGYNATMFDYFFKRRTAYEMRISDWSSDVCTSNLHDTARGIDHQHRVGRRFDDQTQAFFAALAFGDGDYRCEHEDAFRHRQRIQADLDRHLAAVLAQTEEVAAGAHRARVEIGRAHV